MIYADNATLVSLSIFRVGNSGDAEEGLPVSEVQLEEEEVSRKVLDYFLSDFPSEAWFHFQEAEPTGAETLCSAIDRHFTLSSSNLEHNSLGVDFATGSQRIAHIINQRLLELQLPSCHLMVACIQNLITDGEETDAIGLFLAESRKTALSLHENEEGCMLSIHEILKPDHPDRGCIVFNTDTEEGFLVALSGDSGKTGRLWKESVLRLHEKENAYSQTKACIGLCKEFVVEKLPEAHPVDKAAQAGLLHRSAQYFKENDSFSVDSFAEEVIREPEMIASFKSYREEVCRDQEAPLPDRFDISEAAVKKGARVFKSAIKLDKNFHIYVHGDRDRIRKGFDPQTGLHFYQIFFEEEL